MAANNVNSEGRPQIVPLARGTGCSAVKFCMPVIIAAAIGAIGRLPLIGRLLGERLGGYVLLILFSTAIFSPPACSLCYIFGVILLIRRKASITVWTVWTAGLIVEVALYFIFLEWVLPVLPSETEKVPEYLFVWIIGLIAVGVLLAFLLYHYVYRISAIFALLFWTAVTWLLEMSAQLS